MQNFLLNVISTIIHCDVITVVYQTFIPWVLSTAYDGKRVINIIFSRNFFSKDFIMSLLARVFSLLKLDIAKNLFLNNA